MPTQHLDADKAGDSGVLAGFVQMLQGNLGPGILTLPFVFTQAGVILTSFMLVLVSLFLYVIIRVGSSLAIETHWPLLLTHARALTVGQQMCTR